MSVFRKGCVKQYSNPEKRSNCKLETIKIDHQLEHETCSCRAKTLGTHDYVDRLYMCFEDAQHEDSMWFLLLFPLSQSRSRDPVFVDKFCDVG